MSAPVALRVGDVVKTGRNVLVEFRGRLGEVRAILGREVRLEFDDGESAWFFADDVSRPINAPHPISEGP